jgi:hypothetical protein
MTKAELLEEYKGVVLAWHLALRSAGFGHVGSFKECQEETCVWYREVIRNASGVNAQRKPA